MSDKFFVLHTNEDEPLGDILDWNYELPPMLFPLFSAKPIYTSENVYFDAQEGYQLFKEMYEFLAQHKDKIFKRPEEFMAYKEKILKEVKPVGDHYYLSGETMFQVTHNCDEEGVVLELTKKLYADIEKVNIQIKVALAENDIEKFWGIMTEDGSEACHSDSLGEWFSDEKYKYGYAPLSISTGPWNTKDDDYENYTENEKLGLKLSSGEIVTEAKYEEIYAFDETSQIAVIKRDGKYGYIDQRGFEIIEPVYDDAYSLWVIDPSNADDKLQAGRYRARAVKNGKYGLIDEKNNVLIPFEWDDMSVKESENYFIPNHILVKRGDKLGIYDQNGKEKFPVVIDEYLLGTQTFDEADKEYPIYGFAQCLLIKVEEKWVYLNNKFEPYGQDLYIKDEENSIQNLYALNEEVPSDQNICLFKLRNKDWFWGVISSNDDILVPFNYRNIELLELPNGSEHYYTYKAKKDGLTDVYRITKDLRVELIFSEKCKKIKFLSEKIVEVTSKKIRLYDVDQKKYATDLEYDYCLYFHSNYSDHSIFTITGNEVHQYHALTFERMEVNSCELSAVIDTSDVILPLSFLKWFKEFKIESSTKAKKEIFSSQEDLMFIEKNLPEVDFSNDLDIYFAAGNIYSDYNTVNLELFSVALRKIDILHIAHFHHVQRNPTDNAKLEHMGLISIYIAYMLYAKPDEMAENEGSVERDIQKINECLQYAREHIPVKNVGFYGDVFRLSILTAFNQDDHYSCMEHAQHLLSFTHDQSVELEASQPLMRMKSRELNARRKKLKNDEELCHYHLGSVYIGADLEDYPLARKHIELAMKCGDRWNYEKKYVQAVAMSEVESIDVFFPVLEDFDKTAQELKYTDFRWLFIRYVIAYHEYHSKANIKRALDLIEEALAVDPNFEFLVDLKSEIGSQH
jgi:hypothetical protein